MDGGDGGTTVSMYLMSPNILNLMLYVLYYSKTGEN